MLPGLDRNVQTAADLLVSVLEGAEKRLEPEDAIRWMLLSLGPEERIPPSIQQLVLQTCEDQRVQGRGGSRAVLDLCPQLGDRHPELLAAFHAWCCRDGTGCGLIRGHPDASVKIRHLSGRAAAWLDAGKPVAEVLSNQTVVLGPIGTEGAVWWSGGGTLTLELGQPAVWSPEPFTLVRAGVASEVRATPLRHGDRIRRGEVELSLDQRPLEERAREAVAGVPELSALLPRLSPTLQLLAMEAARWPRREVPQAIQELLDLPMDPPVRALLLVRAHWAFHVIEARSITVGALDRDVPLMEKDGRGPHADTVRVGTREHAFFLGRPRGRGRWLFVHGEGRVAYLHTEDARGYRMTRLPDELQG